MAALLSGKECAVAGAAAISVAGPGPGSLTPSGPDTHADLAALDNQTLPGIVRLMPQASGRRVAACEHLGVSRDDQHQAQQAELAFQPSSLDAPLAGQPGTISLAEHLGEEDPRLEHMLAMRALATHWDELTPREQSMLVMNFGGGMTQTEIGRRLRIAQMHVSRLGAHALRHLRSRLLDLEDVPARAGGGHPGAG